LDLGAGAAALLLLLGLCCSFAFFCFRANLFLRGFVTLFGRAGVLFLLWGSGTLLAREGEVLVEVLACSLLSLRSTDLARLFPPGGGR